MSRSMSTPSLHGAARLEDTVNRRLQVRFRARGWVPVVFAYTGYGAPGWARVMCRVLIGRRGPDDAELSMRRGWRSFVTIPATETQVAVRVGDKEHVLTTDRSGYLDARIESDLPIGWGEAHFRVIGEPGCEQVRAPIRVIDPTTKLGIVSDVDDTVMVTTLPRAMLAAWNTFVLNENARRQVTGMSVMYERLSQEYPDAPFIYLSTGAWNVAPTLRRFLSRNLYPRGPLLLTDWGPTTTGWFRSGQLHKRRSLRRLFEEFPDVRWLLIGDDGQHDPDIYSVAAREYPGHVAAVAIRTLSPTEQVLASGLPVPLDQARFTPGTPWVQAPDGDAMWRRLHEIDLLDDRHG